MRTVTVDAPGGTTWRVRVEWLPRWHGYARTWGGWRRGRAQGVTGRQARCEARREARREEKRQAKARKRGERNRWWDYLDPSGLDLGDLEILAIAVLVAVASVAVFWWVLLPLLLVVLDVLAVVVLLLVGTLLRVLFRRPWTVEAVSGGGQRLTERTVGWRRALRARDDLAERLRIGSVDLPATAPHSRYTRPTPTPTPNPAPHPGPDPGAGGHVRIVG